MASFFIPGERKTRPGVYFRYENSGSPPTAGADDGRCAGAIRSNWGPLGKAVLIEGPEGVAKAFGDGGADGTTAVLSEQFDGGARQTYAVRLGSGGTQGTYGIKDTANATVATLAMKHPGSRAFLLTVRPTLEDPGKSELLLLEGTAQLERFAFDNTANGVDGLIAAVESKGSAYFTLAKLADSAEPIDAVDQAAITPGTDPAVNVAAYSAAFEVLEAYRWNVLSIDTDDAAVHAMMRSYLNRVYQGGKFVMGAVGEGSSVPFDTRLGHAAAYNDYQMVYVGTGFVDNTGATHEGWRAAARVAGMIAGTPSNESITHLPVAGAADVTEALTNGQHERAIQAGMLMFSTSAAGAVWVEQGINTLTAPGASEDAGWKKIKRVKVRFELMQRLNDTVEALVGRINNDPDGRATIIQSGNGVCNEMVAEKKLLAGARCELDPSNAPEGDSAWFLVFADDVDALEKLYFTFRFRFAPDEGAA